MNGNTTIPEYILQGRKTALRISKILDVRHVTHRHSMADLVESAHGKISLAKVLLGYNYPENRNSLSVDELNENARKKIKHAKALLR